ncbi:MAG: orotate phosphoribosyltransferase [Chloroflexi bacterium]|nr:orotate phosphoribosyltransferase [Chloroflexota bacterium]
MREGSRDAPGHADQRARAVRILNLATKRGALLFGDFTLSSGQKSRYYFDGRLLSLDPEGLREIAEALLPKVIASDAKAVGGPTLAADPIVGGLVLLSEQRGQGLRGFIVRGQTKQHGTGKLIEGPLEPGLPVAIVDDTVSTGGNLLKAIEAAEAAGCKVVKVLAILDRRQGGSDELRRRGYSFEALLEASPAGDIRPV